MIAYLVKRLLLFIPTLGVMSFFVFYLAQFSQNDLLVQKEENQTRQVNETILDSWQTNYKEAQRLGFHTPVFYFSVFRMSSSDTLNRIQHLDIRQNLEALAHEIGNWQKVSDFFSIVKTTLPKLESLKQQVLIEKIKSEGLQELKQDLFVDFPSVNSSYNSLITDKSTVNNFLLHFTWNGSNNQYHQWISQVVQGNFGKSLVDNSAVNEKISNAIYWTVLLSIISLIITFSIAIPAAFYSSFHPNYWMSDFLDKLFFLLYAIPNFWIATLLILFFASGDYLDWFPTYGVGYANEHITSWNLLLLRIKHLTLPIIALSYGSIAFVYKQLKASIEQELKKDYMLTARAKGLSQSSLVSRQLFKNASFPLITMLGGIIPALFSGSFIIETIFSIPGMGKVSVEAILSRDFSTIYILLLIATFFSMLGLLFADLLYHWADPRVQLSSTKKSKR